MHQLRYKLINYGKIYSKYPLYPYVRGHFYKLNRQYSRLRKFKHKEYKKSLIQDLQSLHDNNPKQYWNIINDLKGKENKDTSSDVPPSRWVSHFHDLNSLKDSFKTRLAQLEEKLVNLEQAPCFNDLGNLITDNEISSAILKLKCDKSPGMDNISNYMLKHSQTVILPCLSKIFNSCLSYGKYPKVWTEGYVTMLHKSEETDRYKTE